MVQFFVEPPLPLFTFIPPTWGYVQSVGFSKKTFKLTQTTHIDHFSHKYTSVICINTYQKSCRHHQNCRKLGKTIWNLKNDNHHICPRNPILQLHSRVIICANYDGRSPQCYIPSFVEIDLPVSEKKNFEVF